MAGGCRSLAAAFGPALLFLGLSVGLENRQDTLCHMARDKTTIYDFEAVPMFQTQNSSLREFEGKVVLVVNVATY
ncbi:unnamed protein product [Cyprideis torosa]|uniref:Uncharacterized protein n=1 Tax=Cyprideis torosa TaxID=163714 RepID=A0A7R8ZVE1_9CRUS|nr:unnamed protein product [Cyprideis torosa]CAG0910136.1 unnamed protein product [Cyprideis torosa]